MADDDAGDRGARRRGARRLEVAGVKRGRWFLPESPDVVGLLRQQLAVTTEGMDAFAAWAAGDGAAADTVRACEHRADAAKHEVRLARQAAFVTALEPEDVFALSRGVDWLLNHAKDTINESEVMACPPDDVLAEMAALLADGLRHIGQAIARLGGEDGDATEPAGAAIKAERNLERSYRAGMAALLESDDLRDVIGRRELYRRTQRLVGADVVDDRAVVRHLARRHGCPFRCSRRAYARGRARPSVRRPRARWRDTDGKCAKPRMAGTRGRRTVA
jgi:uncharacterized protein Yka (UPF0111/DUF47 family)